MRHNQILFTKDCDEIAENPLTTDAIRDYCKDLKVLGKGELQQLIKWRFKILRKEAGEKKVVKVVKTVTEDPEEVAERQLNDILERKTAEERAALKRKREKDKRQAMRMKASLGGHVDVFDPDLFAGKST